SANSTFIFPFLSPPQTLYGVVESHFVLVMHTSLDEVLLATCPSYFPSGGLPSRVQRPVLPNPKGSGVSPVESPPSPLGAR
ncbi:hypothetical protein N7456_005153, partial [Penicillium angulare]